VQDSARRKILDTMFEVELKFQVPEGALPGVRRALMRGRTQRQHLQALYHDTADRALALAGMALRLRKEGRAWVQTLKAAGAHPLQRLEHNVRVAAGPAGQAPALDVQRHTGAPAGEALLALLREAGDPPLQLRYRSDIRRTRRELRSAGARIELALDEGELVAGERRLPVCELEFELLSGSLPALLAVAARWAVQHGLWLDVRSKAERGDRLAEGRERGEPVKSRAPELGRGTPPAQALRAMLHAGLRQVLANAAEVAGGDYEAEHVHQLRVGLRRLRTALRLFGDVAADVDAGWESRLAEPFRRLSAARDRDALAASLLPQLQADGAPALSLPAQAGDDAAALVREPGFAALLLELLGFVAADAPPPESPGALDKLAAKRLQRLHERLADDAPHFCDLPDPLRHRARKRVKRLRYGLEFVAPLLRGKALARYLDALGDAQDALGAYNDLVVAHALFESSVAEHPQAWFALGWIAAKRPRVARDCERALKALAKAPRPWKD
jgi:inorganic triphosphatase YgiF